MFDLPEAFFLPLCQSDPVELRNLAFGGTMIACLHRMEPGAPKMVLKDDGSSIIVSDTKVVTGLAEIDRTISPSELIYNQLKPMSTLLGLRSLSSL